jgi:hypothetical protein
MSSALSTKKHFCHGCKQISADLPSLQPGPLVHPEDLRNSAMLTRPLLVACEYFLLCRRRGVAPLLVLRCLGVGEQQGPQFAIAEPVDGELASADCLDQSGVIGRVRVQCPNPAAGIVWRSIDPAA